jgi:thiol-disulfide isomerase/thioredoxin
MKFSINLILWLYLFVMPVFAQQATPQDINAWNNPVQKNIAALHVGDHLPAIKIANIYNGDKHTTSTADFDDRLLIFDFGNTHCGGCVEALPHMDSLQKEFGDKIRIFWVTYEPENVVADFWKHSPMTKNNSIQTICGDSTFMAYFRHKTWPHEAWVYKGKLVAITGPEHVDAKSIQEILNGNPVNWPVKDDFYVFNGYETPLFTSYSGLQSVPATLLKYAAISGYREGVNSEGMSGGSGIVRDTEKKTVRAFFLNQPIYTSYVLLYNSLIKPGKLVKPTAIGVGPNEVVWEVGNKSQYKYDKSDGYVQDWLRKHAICFESLNPDTGQTDLAVSENMISDLNRLLGLNVRWEKRKEKVYILIRTTNQDAFSKKSSGKGMPVSNIVYQLNQNAVNPYVFDETHYTGNERPDLNIQNWTDIAGVNTAIKAYGMVLKEEEREVDKLVFSEVDKSLLLERLLVPRVVAKQNNK